MNIHECSWFFMKDHEKKHHLNHELPWISMDFRGLSWSISAGHDHLPLWVSYSNHYTIGKSENLQWFVWKWMLISVCDVGIHCLRKSWYLLWFILMVMQECGVKHVNWYLGILTGNWGLSQYSHSHVTGTMCICLEFLAINAEWALFQRNVYAEQSVTYTYFTAQNVGSSCC